MSTNIDGADGADGKGCGATCVFSMTTEWELRIWGGYSISWSLYSAVVMRGGGDDLGVSHRKTSFSSDSAVDVAWAAIACLTFRGDACILPGVFTRSTKELNLGQKGGSKRHDGVLLLRCRPYIIKVLVEEKETLGLDLIFKKLSTWVVYHCVSDGGSPS
jgi:hypothetical protein